MSENFTPNFISNFMRARLTPGIFRDPFDELLDEILNEDLTPIHVEAINALMLTKLGQPRKRKRTDYSRARKGRKNSDPWLLSWLMMYADSNSDDPTSKPGKKFRRKFRVPKPVFKEIVRLCRETLDPVFCYKEKDAVGNSSIPLELKIMSVLRTLASGGLFTDIADMTGFMSEVAANTFFKDFCRVFRQHYEKEFIRPLSGEEFARAVANYARLGSPGCVGSIDGTFVGPWDGVSRNLKNVMEGDKGKGLIYEVVIEHSGLVLSVEGGYYGTVNDKTSIKYSDFIGKLRRNELYQDWSYKIYTGEGENDFITLSSWYVIADGGYLEWPCLICGFDPSSERVKFKFSDWIGSIRKDVECFFGRLKQRFRWFKCPIRMMNKEDIDNAFVVACIIHNMILRYDGLNSLWESNVNWKKMNPDNEDSDEDEEDEAEEDDSEHYYPQQHDDTFQPLHVADLPFEGVGMNREKAEFKRLQMLLANHLQIMYRKRLLCWPKTRSEINRRYNIIPRANFPDGRELDEI